MSSEQILHCITHPLSTMRHVDVPAMLEEGDIIETGAHERLPDQNKAAFYDLSLADQYE